MMRRQDAGCRDASGVFSCKKKSGQEEESICGNTFRCVWALREYPASTEEQAILKRLGEKDGVTLRIASDLASSKKTA